MTSPAPEQQLEVFRAGSVELVSEAELLAKLRLGRPLRVKLGCDPSAPDLHVGHCVPLDKLRQLQELGHRVIFLVGDFTGMIGDPSGRSGTRPALSREEVKRNAATYREQVGAVLDESRIEIRFNSEWLDRMTAADMLRLASHHPVARMLERDDFRTRHRSGVTIGVHEFLYPLIQAYDSVALEADVELGGTDQTYNMLLGREIQRAYGQSPQIVLTLPLLEGIDGVKMSKSVGNAIGIREPASEIYGKTMSIPDRLLSHWVMLLAQPDWTDVRELQTALEGGSGNPRDLKAALALRLVERFQGPEAAAEAEQRFERVFRQRRTPEDVPHETLCLEPGRGGMSVAELLTRTGMAASRGAAKRLVAQGGVQVDERRIEDPFAELGPGEHLLKVGKRRFLRLSIQAN